MSDFPKEAWAGEKGTRWLAHVEALEATIAPFGRALLERAGLRSGERVADIGCGAGATTLDIARQVGPGGSVLGVDVAPMLIAKAHERLAAAGLDNVDFLVADAEVAALPGATFDLLYSRFGMMFFNDSGAAFANLRLWLRPGGRLALACWAAPRRNRWFKVVGEVIARHAAMPEPEPDAPGPFRLADTESVRNLLAGAGFQAISVELCEAEQALGGEGAGPEQAADFVLAAMSVADPARQAGADLTRLRGELADALRPFERDGAVRIGGAAWLVTADNPG